MYHRIVAIIFVAFLTVVCSPDLIKGQSIDSLLYLIDNDLVKDDAEKYDLLSQVIKDIDDTDTENKIRYCDQAIELAQKLDILPALPYIEKGHAYLNSSNYAAALDCYMTAAKYYKTNDDNSGLGKAYNYVAQTYNLQGNRENEKLYLQNAIEIFEQEKDSIYLGVALHNLGYANYSMGQYDSALVLYTETLDLLKKLGTPYAYRSYYVCLGNMGLVYSRLSEFDKAEEYLVTAIDTLDKLSKRKDAAAEFLIGYAVILQQKGEIKQAIANAFRALITTDIPNYERDASRLLAQLYEISGMIDSAYYYQSKFVVINDSINNEAIVRKMADQRTAFEVGRIQAEVDALEKNKLYHNIIILGLVIILLMAVGIILLYYVNLKRTRKLMAVLDERRALLEKQSTELKEKNDKIIRTNEELKQLYEITNNQKEEIISSISYAQRIQQAILPPEAYITELINENFVFYKPKEIVSGDFYWIKQINQYVILVAADCTGHGVPGALMSMLGLSSLNEIVQRKEITQANQILNELRKEIKHSLRQTGKKEESRDGIDMALCVIDTDQSLMQYSGAFSPLYIVSNNGGVAVINEIEPDKMPVGVHFSGDTSFTNHEIRLEIGDTFYLSTDGFIDQIGGSNNSRFGSKNLKKLLLEIHDQPLFEQKEILEQTLNDWMGKQSQRDDILVIGARV